MALAIGAIATMEGTLEAQEKKRRILEEDKNPRASLSRYNTRSRRCDDPDTAAAMRAERLERKRAAFAKRNGNQ